MRRANGDNEGGESIVGVRLAKGEYLSRLSFDLDLGAESSCSLNKGELNTE